MQLACQIVMNVITVCKQLVSIFPVGGKISIWNVVLHNIITKSRFFVEHIL